ncbi:MAG: amidohydrolase [Candidatus Latescibacteria bacterium]|nr:amidohydrolase [Candidatus Latescibacterota bacterium]
MTAMKVEAQPSLDALVDREIASLVEAYKTLHAAPELSRQEEKTSAFLAKELRSAGYAVTERVGKYDRAGWVGYGVVGVLKNGEGPTVLVRTDLDALPVEEKTGLPYASRVRTKNDAGQEVGVMHACGHDIHIASLIGTARALVQLKDRWRGTLVLVGQPSEEIGAGAGAMLNDGLYTRFPRPDYALALHDNAELEAGKVGYCPGYALASVTSVDVTVRGVGGHGSKPEMTKDPVVVAAQVVLALQTIVSREVSPLDPAVVTVGSIHGGTKHNIIPDEVKLQITVRAYKEEVRRKILASIERISRGVALAAGVPDSLAPVVDASREFTPATYNDPELTRRLTGVFEKALGREKVTPWAPIMAGEDFGRYRLEGDQIPICLFWLGAVDPAKVAEGKRTGAPLPYLHSSAFAPLPEPTIRTGVKAMTSAVLELMKR